MIRHPANLKEFEDDDFKFDENGEMFSERVEKTLKKPEIGCYEEFSFLFPQSIPKTSSDGLFPKGIE